MTPKTTVEPRGKRYLPDLLLGTLPILVGVQLLGWITFLPGALLHGHADFRQLYAAGYMVRTGHAGELYDIRAQQKFQDALVGSDERALPFIRPAYQALLFVPFSLLPYRGAYLAFLAVNLALLALVFRMLRSHMSNLARVWRFLPVFVFLVFYPVALALMQGQDSILLLLLLAAALVALDGGRDLRAGVLLGLGLFKMQIVIPVALLFLLWRRWRFVAGFVLSACLLSLISLGTVGFAQTADYIRSLLSVGTNMAAVHQFPLRVSIMANLRGLFFGLLGARVPAFWIQVLTVAASVSVLLWVALAVPVKQKSSGAFVIAITASLIMSYYLFIHDLSVLLIPIVITLDRFILADPERPATTLDRAAAWMSAALLVAPLCIFLMPEHFYLVALPLCAFMVILIRSFPGELQPLNSARCE
ncbi:MAG: glycosyltransferase family 87 protein [Terriglobales bacterium]